MWFASADPASEDTPAPDVPTFSTAPRRGFGAGVAQRREASCGRAYLGIACVTEASDTARAGCHHSG